jgi:hypothetical protein
VRPSVLQRKRIEFELLSKNIIVCWEHNWKDCPPEVIELKKVMEEMRGM